MLAGIDEHLLLSLVDKIMPLDYGAGCRSVEAITLFLAGYDTK